jgi:hypothetical protein
MPSFDDWAAAIGDRHSPDFLDLLPAFCIFTNQILDNRELSPPNANRTDAFCEDVVPIVVSRVQEMGPLDTSALGLISTVLYSLVSLAFSAFLRDDPFLPRFLIVLLNPSIPVLQSNELFTQALHSWLLENGVFQQIRVRIGSHEPAPSFLQLVVFYQAADFAVGFVDPDDAVRISIDRFMEALPGFHNDHLREIGLDVILGAFTSVFVRQREGNYHRFRELFQWIFCGLRDRRFPRPELVCRYLANVLEARNEALVALFFEEASATNVVRFLEGPLSPAVLREGPSLFAFCVSIGLLSIGFLAQFWERCQEAPEARGVVAACLAVSPERAVGFWRKSLSPGPPMVD